MYVLTCGRNTFAVALTLREVYVRWLVFVTLTIIIIITIIIVIIIL